MLDYALALFGASLALYRVAPSLGPLYAAVAVSLGLVFIALVGGLWRRAPWATPERVLFASLLYAAALFGSLVAGTLV